MRKRLRGFLVGQGDAFRQVMIVKGSKEKG
jgi:hypothetical protein